jgi:hypothetical protein
MAILRADPLAGWRASTGGLVCPSPRARPRLGGRASPDLPPARPVAVEAAPAPPDAVLVAALRRAGICADCSLCPGPPGRLSALSVFLCKSFFYGAFVWARRRLTAKIGGFRPGQAARRCGLR